MLDSIFREGDVCPPRRRRKFPWPLVVIVVVVVAVAPWLNPQMVAVLCAVLGGTLPVFAMRSRQAYRY